MYAATVRPRTTWRTLVGCGCWRESCGSMRGERRFSAIRGVLVNYCALCVNLLVCEESSPESGLGKSATTIGALWDGAVVPPPVLAASPLSSGLFCLIAKPKKSGWKAGLPPGLAAVELRRFFIAFYA